jgi:hypothetical protein
MRQWLVDNPLQLSPWHLEDLQMLLDKLRGRVRLAQAGLVPARALSW